MLYLPVAVMTVAIVGYVVLKQDYSCSDYPVLVQNEVEEVCNPCPKFSEPEKYDESKVVRKRKVASSFGIKTIKRNFPNTLFTITNTPRSAS